MRIRSLLLIAVAAAAVSVPTLATAQCTPEPLPGCRAPLAPGKSLLMLRERDGEERDLLQWKWLKGDATNVAAFGDPTTSTGYDLCLYDETAGVPELVNAVAIEPGRSCRGQDCWKARTHGFKYADKDGTPDGVVSMYLHDGGAGTSHISLKASGVNVGLPPLPLAKDGKVTIQLRNDLGECWGADYSTASRNDTGNFKAKSD